MVIFTNNETWRDFISLFREHPELWRVKSDIYKNRDLKLKAYEKLLDKMKELEPNATIDTVKRRLNALRTSFRRELLKEKRSQKSGAGAESVYVPTLWYYKELEFLRDQELPRPSTSSLDSDSMAEILVMDKTSKRKSTDLLEQAMSHLKHLREMREKPKDNVALYLEAWGDEFRKLDENQKMWAKLGFDQILLKGKQNQLSWNFYQNSGLFSTSSEDIRHQEITTAGINNDYQTAQDLFSSFTGD